MGCLLAAAGIGVGVYFGFFNKKETDDGWSHIYQKLKVENFRYRIINFPQVKLKPTTGKDYVRDTTDLDAFFGSPESQTEIRNISNDVMINGYTESNWIELNLFGRYKVRKISSS